jgi:hypothetical protein
MQAEISKDPKDFNRIVILAATVGIIIVLIVQKLFL